MMRLAHILANHVRIKQQSPPQWPKVVSDIRYRSTGGFPAYSQSI